MIKYEKRAREAKNVEFDQSWHERSRHHLGMGGQTSPADKSIF